MADFTKAYQQTMSAEGGYVNDPQDPGGETYKGVARKFNAKWDGWTQIDLLKRESGFPRNLDSNTALQEKITQFYEVNYWDKLRCDEINDQFVASVIFDYGVNAGTGAAAQLAQGAVGATVDGVLGPETLGKINATDPRTFVAVYSLLKIKRYVNICENRPESKKFFYGWVRRTLGGVKS